MEPTKVAERHEEDADALGLGALRDQATFAARAPLRHPWIAAATFIGVAAAVVAAVLAIPHRYRVNATLLAQSSTRLGAISNPGLNRQWIDAPTRGAREVVIRRDHLEAIVAQIELVDRYLGARAPAVRARDWLVERITGHPRDRTRLLNDLVDGVSDRLWVASTPDGALLFTFEWSDPEIARDVVQAAVQTFLDERYTSEIEAIGETVAILRSHDVSVQRELSRTLDAVEAKQRELGIRSLPSVPLARGKGPDEEVARLQAELVARRRALADVEAFRQQRVADARTQLLRDEARYGGAHPALIEARRALDALSRPSPQIAQLRSEAEDLERQLSARGHPADAGLATDAAQNELNEARMRLLLTDDPRLAVERRRLEDLARQHSALTQRIDDAALEMDTARADFKYRYSVIDPARLPKHAAKPYALLALLGAVLGGAVMAIIGSLAVDVRAGRVLEPWQLERTLHLPVLGRVDP